MGSSQNQKQPMPALGSSSTTTTSTAELLQAQAELWCHTSGYLKSTVLRCAIKLGIPNAVSRLGGAASLSELHDALLVAPSKRPCLARLMRLLAATGIFSEEEEEKDDTTPGQQQRRYCLTPVSRLLVDDDGVSQATSLSPYVVLCLSTFVLLAYQRLPEWLETEDGAAAATSTPLTMAHGTDMWGLIGRDAEFGAEFNDGMRADSHFVASLVVRECGEVFAGVESLADVGGGGGTMAKAIAQAFPGTRCSVLELPQVVRSVVVPGLAGGGEVEFVAGDMMEFIPPADALLLKFILHDWNDEAQAQNRPVATGLEAQ